MIQVIINADDFGKSPERNRAINDSFKLGLIRSAGMIVTGNYLQDALNYANSGGYLDRLHLHFNFTNNLLLENSEDRPLTEAMKNDPIFCTEGMFNKYQGLSNRLTEISKWKLVYNEMVAQYNYFKEVTGGEANYDHIDFHMWYNLTWPVSIALNFFTRKYSIKSVRYSGLHQKKWLRKILFCFLSWNPRVKSYPATNIDYCLSKNLSFVDNQVVELYCHPNYKDNVALLDDSYSYLNHEKLPMLQQIQRLQELGNISYCSWEDRL